MRCCARDEGFGPSESPCGGGFKPPCAALAEDRRGERYGEGADERVRWGSGRRCAVPKLGSLLKCRYPNSSDVETGAYVGCSGMSPAGVR